VKILRKDGEDVGFSSHFGRFTIRREMLESLIRYTDQHIPTGSFLQAVISNNLTEAVCQADDENMENLPAFITYLYNYAPAGCWGSTENYKKWISQQHKVETPHNRHTDQE